VKPNLDFTEARDSEWQWHQLGDMQVCTLLETDNHTSTPPQQHSAAELMIFIYKADNSVTTFTLNS